MRTHRRRAGFTQRDLAFLIGCSSGTQVSRYERLEREPTLSVLVAYIIIFEMSGCQLYPALFEETKELVQERARSLYDELQGDPSPRNNAKLDALEMLLERIEERSNRNEV